MAAQFLLNSSKQLLFGVLLLSRVLLVLSGVNFKDKLAEAIELIGEWELALCEINNPHSCSTIRDDIQQTFMYKLATGVDGTGFIPDGHYKSIPDLLRRLNRCMTKEAQTKINFSYVANKRKMKINVAKSGYVLITGDIAITLEFKQDTVIEKETLSPYVADVNGRFSSMYAHTDIVDAQFVSNVKVPLLRIVKTEGNYGDNVNVSFRCMQYVPVKLKSLRPLK